MTTSNTTIPTLTHSCETIVVHDFIYESLLELMQSEGLRSVNDALLLLLIRS